MEIFIWVIIVISFIIAFVGLIYPIIPSALFMFASFLLYQFFLTDQSLGWIFWTTEILFLILLFFADTLSNLVGVKKFGGSNAGMWGSTIGLAVGPFVIPFAGILLGPFIGAVIGELIVNRTSIPKAVKVGIGSLVGFLTSVVTKGVIMIVMIVFFVIFIR